MLWESLFSNSVNTLVHVLQHPEHVQHLILVGPAGFSTDPDMSERLIQFRATWKGAILNHLWESNFTPQKIVR